MATVTAENWVQIHARAWTDSDFAAAFHDDPRAALQKYGPEMGIDPDAKFAFADRPDDLSDEDVDAMASGKGSGGPISMHCC